MKVVRVIAALMIFAGLLTIPGAIESGQWKFPIGVLVAGIMIFTTIERCWYFEEDFDDSDSDYSDDVNDFYGY